MVGTGGQVINIGDIAFDAVPAEQGDDTILGGGGNDVIFGEGGDDSIRGEAGLDQIDGRRGAATRSRATVANDTITGGAGDDRIEGGAGADLLSGGTGADTVLGGAGNDTINAGQGDSADGGDGDDLFVLIDTGEGPADMTITGGEGAEINGDVLDLGGLNTGPINYTSTTPGDLAGWVELIDGSILTFSEIEDVICFTPGTNDPDPLGRTPDRDAAHRRHGRHPRRGPAGRSAGSVGAWAAGSDGMHRSASRRAAPYGTRRPTLLSPQHRVMVSGWRAQMIWGEDEVLVAAKHLVDDPFRAPGPAAGCDLPSHDARPPSHHLCQWRPRSRRCTSATRG